MGVTYRRLDDEILQIRDSFKQMGQAAGDGFTHALVYANSFRSSVRTLGQEIETSLIQTFVAHPLEKMMQTGLESLFGKPSTDPAGSTGSSSGGSTGGGLPSTGGGGAGIAGGIGNMIAGSMFSKGIGAIGDAIWSGAKSLFGFSTGGVIDHGMPTRYLASGGLIDRPTVFYAAGGTVMAGESDTEAVMPLKRLPNGNLGVASSGGGGGGPMIMVHAPVTIQGGGGGQGGGMSAGQMKALQKQMEQVHTAAVRNVLQHEMRDGGDLASPIGAFR